MTTAISAIPVTRPAKRRRPRPVFQTLPFVITDAIAIFSATALAVVIRRWFGDGLVPALYLRMSAVAVFVFSYAAFGLYPSVVLHPVNELRAIVQGTTVSVLLLAAMSLSHFDGESYSGIVLVAGWLLGIVLVWSGREVARRYLSRKDWWGERAVILRTGSAGRSIAIIPNLCAISTLGVDAHDVGGAIAIRVNHRLLFRVPQVLKRTIDLLLALTAVIVVAPLFLVIGILIRGTSRGPLFYGHQRIGRGGRKFAAWKFRTMVRDSDGVLQWYLAMHPGPRAEWIRSQKLRSDPRVTCMGKLLRRTSLDELPQLWNVIRGEMSLVGPRPIVQSEVDRYGVKYALYKRVRPGLTGLWQVSGRNNTSYSERIHFDEYYVRNWSMWLDLYILAKTVRVVLTGDGAY
jgi:lipopolysaccharide/colanic/teichoic acid biosynthesis glycosyltransferase